MARDFKPVPMGTLGHGVDYCAEDQIHKMSRIPEINRMLLMDMLRHVAILFRRLRMGQVCTQLGES